MRIKFLPLANLLALLFCNAGAAEVDPGRWQGWCDERAGAGESAPLSRLNLPAWACIAAFTQNLQRDYLPYTRINPFFLNGDFDGGGRLGMAVWIAQRSSGKLGIAIFGRGGVPVAVIGAGKPWGSLGDDFSAFYRFGILTKGANLESVYGHGKLVHLKTDAFTLGNDSATFAVYSEAGEFLEYRLEE